MVVPGWLVDFLDWGQAPATVRDAHTGEVHTLGISRWEFLRDKQAGVDDREFVH
ncbi:hypothetical protein PSDT_0019 [Parascardovia denticolens DSM 10105 = JCM 12538]|nr:hypothetical protein PSDT_0019 [Parascardovia denticolens DSM 10105 = JCM 12538]